MGTGGHGTGTDHLILAEHTTNSTIKWNNTDTTGITSWTVSGYLGSLIRNTTLKTLYDNELGWAHNYALKPDTTHAAWTDNVGLLDGANSGRTSSSGVLVKDSLNTFDGAFLLSSADLFYSNNDFGWPSSISANAAREGRMPIGPSPNRYAPNLYWSRTTANSRMATMVNTNGERATYEVSTTRALRPAMLLRIP
jgi:hypothetical protein